MPINWEQFLDQAEKIFIFQDGAEFYFDLRRPTGDLDFFSQFDKEIQAQSLFRVSQYRLVKESRVKISRPGQIVISKDSLLRARPHLDRVRDDFKRIMISWGKFGIGDFLKSNYWELKFQIDLVESCIHVLDYLEMHREEVRGLSLRQIPHGLSTKLIGKESILLRIFSHWKSVTAKWSDFFSFYQIAPRAIEFRFFASKCKWEKSILTQFHGVFSSQLIKNYSFPDLERTLFIENYDAFMELSSKLDSTLLVWSGGWRAVALRRFLAALPRPFFYWGDIDKEGFEIFGALLEYEPQMRPLLMDEETLLKYPHLVQRKNSYQGPFRNLGAHQKFYERVCEQGLFIEQEQLVHCFDPQLLAAPSSLV